MTKVIRCEGWRIYGGAFTIGPPQWKQCKNDAIVMLKVTQEETQSLPACAKCWKSSIKNEIEIVSVTPLDDSNDRDIVFCQLCGDEVVDNDFLGYWTHKTTKPRHTAVPNIEGD
ncbi:MAG: hypothetical protein GY804_11535 [Alphaproteobacteria bacterium]|nr:hypothetical protein [Alphaproteobacteria bacterium]